MLREPTPLFAAMLLAVLVPAAARAAETVIPLAGVVPNGEPDHFFVDFEVPAGTVEIEMRHDDLSDMNILDWGLEAPGQTWRGWGGGNAEPAVLGLASASRGYVPGAIEAGTWRVVVGKAKIVETPAMYEIEVVLRDADSVTLAPQPERMPYVPASALESGPRWYAGDFHVHSLESGDADAPLSQILAFAGAAGLDFVEITDHNIDTHLDFFVAAQAQSSTVLLVPGNEFTTYDGHANAVGATAWVDHKIGQPGVTIDEAAAAFHEQGALFAINHPALELGNACIGCAWDHLLAAEAIDAIEIGSGGLEPVGYLFVDEAIAMWDALCDEGRHVAPLGGSDDHRGGAGDGFTYSPIGNPTTLVWADALDVASIVAGVAAGRTVVKLQGPGDPMVELGATDPLDGDTVTADATELVVRVEGGEGAVLRLVHQGAPADSFEVDADPFEIDVPVAAPLQGEERWRAELLVDGTRRVVTSHVWLRPSGQGTDETGGSDSGGQTTSAAGSTSGSDTGGTDESGEGGADDADRGCGCASDRPAPLLWVLALLAVSRGRRRSSHCIAEHSNEATCSQAENHPSRLRHPWSYAAKQVSKYPASLNMHSCVSPSTRPRSMSS